MFDAMTEHRVDEERYLAQWKRLRDLVSEMPPGEQRDDLAEFCETAWRLPREEFKRDRAEAAIAAAHEAHETTLGDSNAKARAACRILGLTKTKPGRRPTGPALLEQWRLARVYRGDDRQLHVRDHSDTLAIVAAEREQSEGTVARELRLVAKQIEAQRDADPSGSHAELYRLDLEMLSEVPTLWSDEPPDSHRKIRSTKRPVTPIA